MKKRTLIQIYLKIVLLPFTIIDVLFKKEFVNKVMNIAKLMLPLTTQNQGIVFTAEEEKIYSRAQTLLTKEPDTIFWIDNYIKENEVLFDIGANIGVYSLYTARKVSGVKIFSFEPESSNYYFLNKNIYLNKFDNKITALNIALNDERLIATLNLSKFIPGSSEHSFNETYDSHHNQIDTTFKQGMIGLTLDELVYEYGLDVPNHVKMDVDGNEHKIISGMQKVLQDEKLKTIAIEIDPDLETSKNSLKIIEDAGFTNIDKEELKNTSYIKTGIYNVFYERK